MPGNKPNTLSTYQTRTTHYLSYLRVPFEIYERKILNEIALGVYEFDPKPGRQFWTYLTSGMSENGQKSASKKERFTELLFYAKERSPWVVEMLVSLSAYPFEYNESFDSGDTIPLAEPIRPNSRLTSLLLLEPFLEKPSFQRMDVNRKRVEFLWVLPITEKEYGLVSSGEGFDFKKMISHEQLPDLLDLNRGDVINSRE